MPRVTACGGRSSRSSAPCWSWRCPPLRSRRPQRTARRGPAGPDRRRQPDGTGLRPLYSPRAGRDQRPGMVAGRQPARVLLRQDRVLDTQTRGSRSLTEPGAGDQRRRPRVVGGRPIGFRRVARRCSTGARRRRRRPAPGGPGPRPTSALAYTPDFDWPPRSGAVGRPLTISSSSSAPTAAGLVAGRQKARLRRRGTSVYARGLRHHRSWRDTPQPRVQRRRRRAPRWAPDGNALVTSRRRGPRPWPGRARHARRRPRGHRRHGGRLAAVHDGDDGRLPVRLAPTLQRASAQVTTQTDQPVELPAPPCTDPAGLPLPRACLRRRPRHVSGWVYTPAPGFIGQDSVTYRVSNGSGVSDLVIVPIFVVPRPAAGGPAPPTNPRRPRPPRRS